MIRLLLACLWLFALPAWATDAAPPPAVTLANVWRESIDPSGYWVSEKLDGVRGFWDGKQLLTRGGAVLHPPAWFTAGWPPTPLDGELWAGRGHFALVVSIVRGADAAAWSQLSYQLFDLPAHPGVFSARITALAEVVSALNKPWVRMIEQTPATTAAALKQQLREVVKAGGEGLMLHRGDALYLAGRSDDLLKLKPFLDAEARVIGHTPGRGKYKGMLGALRVETADGRRFKIGSGFSEEQRRHPPALNTWITYRHRDFTATGLPRFATFLRVREDQDLN